MPLRPPRSRRRTGREGSVAGAGQEDCTDVLVRLELVYRGLDLVEHLARDGVHPVGTVDLYPSDAFFDGGGDGLELAVSACGLLGPVEAARLGDLAQVIGGLVARVIVSLVPVIERLDEVSHAVFVGHLRGSLRPAQAEHDRLVDL